ncbi:MAG TPA: NAD(+)/NADH kinase [bacterium]|nr:NAD(+)/NADH kinase [bacterium]
MPQRRALVVYKESAYTRNLPARKIAAHFKKGDYWDVLRESHERHHASLASVRKRLLARGFELTQVLRYRIHRLRQLDRRFDLVVSVGGDGTLLEVSHHLRRVPLLGVNSDPRHSVARFSGCDEKGFPSLLDGYLEGRVRPRRIARLQFAVNGRPNPWLVLNEILVAAGNPAGTSRYILEVGGRAEEQLSSGVWIGPAAGSTAALFSAGGKRLPLFSDRYQYVVREAYHRKFGKRRLLGGIVGARQKIRMVSYMRQGRIFLDGANLEFPFKLGDRLEIAVSPYPLLLIGAQP